MRNKMKVDDTHFRYQPSLPLAFRHGKNSELYIVIADTEYLVSLVIRSVAESYLAHELELDKAVELICYGVYGLSVNVPDDFGIAWDRDTHANIQEITKALEAIGDRRASISDFAKPESFAVTRFGTLDARREFVLHLIRDFVKTMQKEADDNFCDRKFSVGRALSIQNFGMSGRKRPEYIHPTQIDQYQDCEE
jgi:hypothetical protein